MITKIKKFFLNFSVIFFIAGITSFTAYNWKIMNNYQKLAVPVSLIILGLVVYTILKKDIYKNLALFFSCFMVGTLFAVFGQLYQTGADTWILFRNWAFFLIIPTVISMYYSIFTLLIIVLSLMTAFGLGLYYSEECAFFIATLIPAVVLLTYPAIVEKFKIKFNNFFYNSLIISFYILFNIAGISLIFNNNYYYYKNTSLFLENILTICYPLIVALIFFTIIKKYKKQIVLPFTIVTTGLIFWAFFADSFVSNISYDLTGFFLISLAIFIATLVILIKNLPAIENDFITRTFKGLGNFLKFFIFIFGLGLLFSIVLIANHSEYSFLFLGIITIAASCYLPKILEYKEDNIDLISFLIGLVSLLYFLSVIFQDNLKFIYLAIFAIVIFDIFFFARKSKGMDLLFFPAHYAFILIFAEEYHIPFNDFYMNINLLSILAILILPLQLIFSKRIKNFKYKNRIVRVFYGNNISLLLFFVILPTKMIYGNDFTYNEKIVFEYIIKIRAFIIMLISMYIIYLAFKNKKLAANTENIILNDASNENKNNLKNFLISLSIILIIQCFAWHIIGVNFIILLILFYTYKSNKWTLYFLNIMLCYQIFNYYYNLYDISLLQKAYYMIYLGSALLIAYLIMKFFIKEEANDEQ